MTQSRAIHPTILAFDASLFGCAAALLRADGQTFTRRLDPPTQGGRGRADDLLPMIDAIVSEAGIDKRSIERIAVTTGPGSFTGIRIALAAAKGLALALEADIYPLSSFDALALALPQAGVFAITIPAGRGEFYIQVFADGQAHAARLGSPQDLAPHLPRDLSLAGPGTYDLAEALKTSGHPAWPIWPDWKETLQPDVVRLAFWAAKALERDEAAPWYGRAASVTLPKAKP